MQGLHLTADLHGCPHHLAAMSEPSVLTAVCRDAVEQAGLRVVGEAHHGFAPEGGEPRGVTCVVLLAESHLAVHTWPELGRVTLDVYVCHRHADNSARAEAVVAALIAAFAPGRVSRQRLERG